MTNDSASMSEKSTSLTIALATSSFIPAMGGVEIGLHNIATQLQNKGHRPVVISSYAHVKSLRKTGWIIPYEVVAYPPRILTWLTSHPLIGTQCLKWFHGFLQRRFKFDVWHATIGYPVGISVIKFCQAKNIPHLVRCVGEDIQIKPEINYGMRLDSEIDIQIKRWLPHAQRLVAITESVVEEYRAIGVGENRIVRIPNGIDLPRFKVYLPKNDIRKNLGISSKSCIFLALGRHHPKKNFSSLIKAAALLKSRVKKPFTVIIMGCNVRKLEQQIIDSDVADLVHLCEPGGTVKTEKKTPIELPGDEILDYYAAADIFVMPSMIETFGIVTIEAMAAGLPVIAADSPGSRDVVRGGKDGLMYNGSVEALTHAMEKWIKSKDERLLFASRSRNRAKDFNWSTIVDRYVEEYRMMKRECEQSHKILDV